MKETFYLQEGFRKPELEKSVDNEDVHVVNIDWAEIMIVCVKEAPEEPQCWS